MLAFDGPSLHRSQKGGWGAGTETERGGSMDGGRKEKRHSEEREAHLCQCHALPTLAGCCQLPTAAASGCMTPTLIRDCISFMPSSHSRGSVEVSWSACTGSACNEQSILLSPHWQRLYRNKCLSLSALAVPVVRKAIRRDARSRPLACMISESVSQARDSRMNFHSQAQSF